MKKFIILAIVLLFSSVTVASEPLIQDFLKRSVYLSTPKGTQKSNSYRTIQYTNIRGTMFMGRYVMMNQKVHKPLKCVEKRIKSSCTDDYKPANISSWRTRNTIAGHEISSHVFGIALDIDPHRNPCCGCVAKNGWRDVPRCKNAPKPSDGSAPMGEYDLPECWIDAFKEYGWFWYGDEPTLRDTMHFEFLAKPGSVSCQ